MAKLKLAIFDFDGTIVDSRRNIQVAMERAFAAADLPPPSYDQTRRIVGLNLVEACQRLAPDVDEQTLGKIVDYYKNAFNIMRTEPGHSEPVYEGAIPTLRRLRHEGWLVAGATGKSHRGVETVLRSHDLHDVFDVIRCADDGPGKPHPFMVTACLSHLGVDCVDAIVIGDTSFDMAMARAAGAMALGVSWGFHTHEEILDGGAHHIVHTFEELDGALDRFGVHRILEVQA
ncbi:MAG: HAD-IA family hydrolase [Caulobacterales bacterium]